MGKEGQKGGWILGSKNMNEAKRSENSRHVPYISSKTQLYEEPGEIKLES